MTLMFKPSVSNYARSCAQGVEGGQKETSSRCRSPGMSEAAAQGGRRTAARYQLLHDGKTPYTIACG